MKKKPPMQIFKGNFKFIFNFISDYWCTKYEATGCNTPIAYTICQPTIIHWLQDIPHKL